MITNPTVLILGAGASKPFGFPTGKELKNEVCSHIKGKKWFRDQLKSIGYTDHKLHKFADALHGSPRESIDAFLEYQPDWVELGKAAILCALIPYEQNADLRSPPNSEGNWYQLLYNKLIDSLDRIHENKLSVLTYNYDRSLETYLARGLENEFGLQLEDAIKKIEQHVPIIHLHGSLGPHPYGTGFGKVNLETCASQIKIIHGVDVETDQDFELAKQYLWAAQKICFLGFGYHETNIQRLPINNEWPENSYADIAGHPPPPTKKVWGTTYGLYAPDIKRIASMFKVHTRFDEEKSRLGVYQFLRETEIL